MKKFKGFIMYDPNDINFAKNLEKKFAKMQVVKKYVPEKNDGNWIRVAKIEYKVEGDDEIYVSESAERKNKINKEGIPDAVSVLPYFVENGEVYYLVTVQLRPNMGERQISIAAGLVDKRDVLDNSDVEKVVKKAALRELKEENGANVVKMIPISGIVTKSAGFSNESEQTFLAEVDLGDKKTNLDKDEKLFTIVVPAKYAIDFMYELPNNLSPCLRDAFLSAIADPRCKEFIRLSVENESQNE